MNKYKMTLNDNILFAKRNLVDSIYKEAKLEGIGVTFPETYEIFNGRTVAGLSVDDTIAINNLKHAWEFVIGTIGCQIDIDFVKALNRNIGKGIIINDGMIRMDDVHIGGTTWIPELPEENKIKQELDEIIVDNELSATDKAISIMLYLMRTQMFYDGNKRTAQLAANKIMIEGGAGVIAIPVDDRLEFTKKLVRFYETNEKDDISEFIYERCIDGINSIGIEEIDT